MKPIVYHNVLRAAALIIVPVGALCSVGLMLSAGRRNDSRILLVLFVIWVLSPFMALAWAGTASKRWSLCIRAALHAGMLALTLASLIVYGYAALGPPRTKPAFLFLVVPLVSWLFIATGVVMAVLRRKRSNKA